MSRRLIVRPLAEDDLANAAKWYENEQAGLAPRFLGEADRTLSSIRELATSVPSRVARTPPRLASHVPVRRLLPRG